MDPINDTHQNENFINSDAEVIEKNIVAAVNLLEENIEKKENTEDEIQEQKPIEDELIEQEPIMEDNKIQQNDFVESKISESREEDNAEDNLEENTEHGNRKGISEDNFLAPKDNKENLVIENNVEELVTEGENTEHREDSNKRDVIEEKINVETEEEKIDEIVNENIHTKEDTDAHGQINLDILTEGHLVESVIEKNHEVVEVKNDKVHNPLNVEGAENIQLNENIKVNTIDTEKSEQEQPEHFEQKVSEIVNEEKEEPITVQSDAAGDDEEVNQIKNEESEVKLVEEIKAEQSEEKILLIVDENSEVKVEPKEQLVEEEVILVEKNEDKENLVGNVILIESEKTNSETIIKSETDVKENLENINNSGEILDNSETSKVQSEVPLIEKETTAENEKNVKSSPILKTLEELLEKMINLKKEGNKNINSVSKITEEFYRKGIEEYESFSQNFNIKTLQGEEEIKLWKKIEEERKLLFSNLALYFDKSGLYEEAMNIDFLVIINLFIIILTDNHTN